MLKRLGSSCFRRDVVEIWPLLALRVEDLLVFHAFFWCGVEALQNYLWKHPALLDVTDKKLLKFTESCLERVDMLEFKVSSAQLGSTMADKTWDDFGHKLWMVNEDSKDSKFKNTYHISYDKTIRYFFNKNLPIST